MSWLVRFEFQMGFPCLEREYDTDRSLSETCWYLLPSQRLARFVLRTRGNSSKATKIYFTLRGSISAKSMNSIG
jgi:hypothetical protein